MQVHILIAQDPDYEENDLYVGLSKEQVVREFVQENAAPQHHSEFYGELMQGDKPSSPNFPKVRFDYQVREV